MIPNIHFWVSKSLRSKYHVEFWISIIRIYECPKFELWISYILCFVCFLVTPINQFLIILNWEVYIVHSGVFAG